jgi:hypothetical protein
MTDAYIFLPWVRFGLLADGVAADPKAPVRADASVTLRLSTLGADDRTTTDDLPRKLRLVGPGDVIGIDHREIVRVTPTHQTSNFAPHLLVSIEFDRPDFVWLFTPAAAQADRLAPWIVLAVVRKERATITTDPNRPLPMLECPVSELPNLAESHLWAHAQFTGEPTSAPDFSNGPRTISRLICPRRLRAATPANPSVSYYACLVPGFDVGRKAGLGLPIEMADEQALMPAWTFGPTETTVQLPVYYHWEFATGTLGDFKDLVESIKLVQTPDTGERTMDVSQPGGGIGSYPAAVLGIPSALRAFGAQRASWPTEAPKSYAQLQQALNTALHTPPGVTQGVPPPVYGHYQAPTPTAPGTDPLAENATPRWPAQLNLDPRHRVAASTGAEVVQQRQEQFVERAWQQAAQLQEANQLLLQKHLAREVTDSVRKKRLGVLSEAALQQMTAPLVVPEAGTTGSGSSVQPASQPISGQAPTAPDPLLEAIVSAPFRRIARAEGALSRVAPPPPPTGVVTRAGASTTTAGAALTSPAARLGQLLGQISAGATTGLQLVPARADSQISFAATGLSFGGPLPISPLAPRIVTSSTSAGAVTITTDRLMELIDPQKTFVDEARSRVKLPPELQEAWSRPEPLAPLNVTPVFDEAMYEALRDLFSDRLLPGLDKVPPNSLQLLQADGQFIESFMVGLNDEMSRVLLWREFPTTLRGTYFRQFWDTRAYAVPGTDRETLRDMDPIERWGDPLGGNLRPGRGTGLMVLLFKGDLLQRFPNALIYAAQAMWTTDSTGRDVPVVDETKAIRTPVLRVDPFPGVTLLGFAGFQDGQAGQAEVAGAPSRSEGDAGWFFILEEHPTEPTFGMDITAQARLHTWRLLAWPNVVLRGDGSGYIDAAGSKPALEKPPDSARPEEKDRYDRDLKAAWAGSGASMAYILLNTAFRMEVHGAYWLPRRSTSTPR